MENEFKGDTYYVRDCYPEYYALAMALLSEGEFSGVSVTRTPGIGKSVFMAYFFQRYSNQFPDATIKLLSYTKQSVVKEAVTTWRGQEIERRRRSLVNGAIETVYESTDPDHERAIARPNDQSIWLLDGPPEMIPPDGKWVSFTSPNKDWQAQVRKNGNTCCEVFMSVWTLEELCDAIVKLNRFGGNDNAIETSAGPKHDNCSIDGGDIDADIDTAEVDDDDMDADSNQLNPVISAILDEFVSRPAVITFRFQVFGGVPRVCLQNDDDLVIRDIEDLQAEVKKFTADQVLTAIKDKNAPVEVLRLLHLVPVAEGLPYPFRRKTVQVASIAIERLLAARGQGIASNRQEEFDSIARFVPEMRALQGYSVEARVQRKIKAGCTLNARKLKGNGPDTLDIAVPAGCGSCEILANLEIEGFDSEQTLVGFPGSKLTNLQSIDGFVWIPDREQGPNRVVLLQVTVSLKHPVKALGYKKILEALGHWDAVRQSPDATAALVFVVPTWSVDMFRAQRIVSHQQLDDTSPLVDVVGIGPVTATKLKRLGIHTAGDLGKINTIEDLRTIRVLDDSKCVRPWDFGSKEEKAVWRLVSGAASQLRNHVSGMSALHKASEEEKVLQRIPQYVWGI